MTHFAAIPTMYNGVQFRSRLEARWAAFFDLCGWQWEYEPFDLDGWIPDFVAQSHPLTRPLLVEVKPLTDVDGECVPREVTDKIETALRFPVERDGQEWDYFVSRMKYRFLLFGVNPSRVWIWNTDVFPSPSVEPTPYAVAYREWVFGINWFGTRACTELWKQAGNAVQWKAPRRG